MGSFFGSVLLVSAAFAVGAAQNGARPKWKLHDTDFKTIKSGTSETEVVRRVGRPVLKTEFKRLHERVWDYRYMLGVETYVAEIHFNMSGRVTRVERYPDRCAMQAIPCR